MGHKHSHHILSEGLALKIWGALVVLTGVTVAVALVDLGGFWNILVALLVASLKATLVCSFFMGLKYDSKENVVIFLTSIVFVAIFFVLTGTDVFFRGDVSTKDKPLPQARSVSKISKPWVSTPALVEQGQKLFSVQCASCHGDKGMGDGPAAASMNPKPRNFSAPVGEWKAGRKPSQIFTTVSKGLNTMPAFTSLPSDDRWALTHFVRSIGSAGDEDTAADLQAIGIDPNSDTGGVVEAKTISIDQAIDLLVEPK